MPLIYMGAAGILINIILMALNLLPILPLDGGRIMNSLLPPTVSQQFSRLEPYGLIIIVLLLVSGVLGKLLWPISSFFIALLPVPEILVQRLIQFIFT